MKLLPSTLTTYLDESFANSSKALSLSLDTILRQANPIKFTSHISAVGSIKIHYHDARHLRSTPVQP